MNNNFFGFASKELNQDAFLLWLFNNSGKYSDVVYDLIQCLTGCEWNKNEPINAAGQYAKIDIIVEFTSKGDKYLLAIEDKVSSLEHEQLDAYNEKIDQYASGGNFDKIFKVFYKTWIIQPEEQARVKKSNWKCISIESIAEVFKKYTQSGIQLISEYSNFICGLKNELIDIPISYATIQPKQCEAQYYHVLNDLRSYIISNRSEKYKPIIGRYNSYFFLYIVNTDDYDGTLNVQENNYLYSKYIEIAPNSFTEKKFTVYFKLPLQKDNKTVSNSRKQALTKSGKAYSPDELFNLIPCPTGGKKAGNRTKDPDRVQQICNFTFDVKSLTSNDDYKEKLLECVDCCFNAFDGLG